MTQSQFTIIGASSVFLLIGLYVTLSLLFDYRARKKKEANCTAITLGRIVDYYRYDRPCDDESGQPRQTVYTTEYYPIVVYNANDTYIEKKYHYGLYKQDFKIGQVVNIRYNPCNIEEFYIIEEKREKTGLKRSIAVGTGMIIGSVVLAIYLTLTTTS